MKKWMALGLVLALLALAGCQSEMDGLLGSWYLELDIRETVYSRLAEESPQLAPSMAEEPFPITVCLNFFADGTYQAYVDKQSVEESALAFRLRLEKQLKAYLQLLHQQSGSGITLDAWMQSLGITWEQLLEDAIGSSLADELLLELDIHEEGRFAIKWGKLTMTQSLSQEPNRETYHWADREGDSLTLRPGYYFTQAEENRYALELPVTFHREKT